MTTNTTSKAKQGSIPKWIFWFGVIIMIGAPLVNAIMTFTGSNLGMVTLEDGAVIETGLFKYGVRNIVAAAITAFALYKRSAAMLLLVFIMRFITEFGDLINGIFFQEMDTMSMLMFIAMMIIIAFIPYTLGIRKLWSMVF